MQKQNKFVLPFYAKERNGALKKAGPPNKNAFLLKIAFLFLMSFSIFTAKASHLVGGEISYTKVANALNQYVIKLTLYRDCAGINLQNTAAIQLTNPGSPVQNITLPLLGVATDISLVCPGQLSNCQPGGNGAIAGVQRFIYQATVTLSGSAANPTTVVYSVCCRPNGVSTLQTPGNQNMCVTTTIPPFNAALNNNSPVFVNPPIGVFCQGQPATLALNAFDPDGDALQYFLVPGRQAVNTNCVYIAGLSGTNPVSAVSPATINIGTGVISFTPTVVNQRALIAVRVDEYRNGVKIGEVFRDMEITIKNCAGNTAPVVAPIPNAVVQVGQAYCVPITVTDAQAQNLSVSATGGIIPPGTLTVLNSSPGLVNAEFCFTPSLIHAGNTFSISINANDNFCPVPAASVGSFNITVPAPCNVSVDATATPTTCGLANGTATASMTGGVIPYGFNWTGPGGFISNSQNLTGLIAGVYSITVVDGNNCVASSTVEVLSNGSTIIVNGTAADALCGQNNGSITLNTTGGVPPYMFSLDGGPAQAGNVFSNLAPATYTVVVTDANNCTNGETYVINAAADATPPTAICQNLTAYLDDNGNVNISTADINNGSSDNCNSITFALSQSTFDCSNIGPNTVTLTVTDAALNVASCTAIVTVLDTIAPDLHCQNATLYLDANGNATLTVADVLDHEHEACPIDTFYLSQYDFTCANAGLNNVTVYAIDNSGNIGSCVATVTVLDTIKPGIVCAPDVNVSNDPSQCLAALSLTTPATADNCAVLSVTSNAPALFPVGTTPVLWTVTDVNGNTNSCTQMVTVNDTEIPSITCPQPINVNNDAGLCTASNVLLYYPSFFDNCGAPTITNNAPAIFPVGITYVVWTATDIHNNINTCTQTVTVNDNEAPSITCAANVTVNNDPGVCEASVALTAPATADNCGVLSVTSNAPAVYPVGVTNVVWTVTDIHNNTNTCTQTVTVNDNEAPSITCAANVTVNNDPGVCEASVVLTAPATADNCGVLSVTSNAPAVYPVGVTNVVWTVTDIHNNTNTCTQTVTVNDNEAPSIICAANVTVSNDAGVCEAIVALTAPATADNCGVLSVTNNAPAIYPVGVTNVVWTVTDIHNNTNTCTQTVTVNDNEAPSIICAANVTVNNDAGVCEAIVALTAPATGDNCGVLSVTNNAPATYPVGVTNVLWTVTDIHGNTNTCTQTVTVNDTELPVANCQGVTVTLNAAGEASITAAMIDNNSTDNCGIQSLSVAPSNFTCADIGNNTVTLTVTDLAGNVSTCTAVVVVNPGNNITIAGCPSDINLACVGGNGVVANWTPPTGTLSGPCINTCTGGLPKAGFTYMGTHNGHSYYRSNSDNYNWVQAKNAAIAAGGHLVSINNAAENAFVSSIIAANGNSGEVWIGYIDVLAENSFVWANGDPTGYTSWAPSEPNNNPSGCNCNNNQADYVSMRKNNSKWYDRNICEKNQFIMEVACINPVQIVKIAGPNPGSIFAGGTTTQITYLAYTAAGDSAYCNFTVTVADCIPAYCNQPDYNSNYEYINRVQLNSINNLSGNNNGNGNFVAQNTTLTKGTTYPIVLTPGFNNCSYTEYWKVYIDWNYDGDWNDAGEMAASGHSSSAITRNIAVPNNAMINKGLRMRIIMRYGGYPASPCAVNGCGTQWGEVEDYTVFVQNGMNKTDENIEPIVENVIEPHTQNGIELTSMFPNPINVNQREINLQYRVLQAGNVSVSVQSIDGKVLSTQEVVATEGENRNAISLPNLSAGIYTVLISNADGKHLQKFIVK